MLHRKKARWALTGVCKRSFTRLNHSGMARSREAATMMRVVPIMMLLAIWKLLKI